MKLRLVSGMKDVAAAGTAERLVTAVDTDVVLSVIFQADGDNGIIIGDSTVKWGSGADRIGAIVSDGQGSAAEPVQQLTMSMPSAIDLGLKGIQSAPVLDLYDVWVDAETTGHDITWTGIAIGGPA